MKLVIFKIKLTITSKYFLKHEIYNVMFELIKNYLIESTTLVIYGIKTSNYE